MKKLPGAWASRELEDSRELGTSREGGRHKELVIIWAVGLPRGLDNRELGTSWELLDLSGAWYFLELGPPRDLGTPASLTPEAQGNNNLRGVPQRQGGQRLPGFPSSREAEAFGK